MLQHFLIVRILTSCNEIVYFQFTGSQTGRLPFVWRQIVQDQIICRAIVVIYFDDNLRSMVRIRGGTALNKLLFPFPYRYSEDIDLVLMFEGPLDSILGRLRAVLEPWLGPAKYGRSQVAPKLRFRIQAEYGG